MNAALTLPSVTVLSVSIVAARAINHRRKKALAKGCKIPPLQLQAFTLVNLAQYGNEPDALWLISRASSNVTRLLWKLLSQSCQKAKSSLTFLSSAFSSPEEPLVSTYMHHPFNRCRCTQPTDDDLAHKFDNNHFLTFAGEWGNDLHSSIDFLIYIRYKYGRSTAISRRRTWKISSRVATSVFVEWLALTLWSIDVRLTVSGVVSAFAEKSTYAARNSEIYSRTVGVEIQTVSFSYFVSKYKKYKEHKILAVPVVSLTVTWCCFCLHQHSRTTLSTPVLLNYLQADYMDLLFYAIVNQLLLKVYSPFHYSLSSRVFVNSDDPTGNVNSRFVRAYSIWHTWLMTSNRITSELESIDALT